MGDSSSVRSVLPGANAGSIAATKPKGVPPHLYFVTSAIFHYLGPASAVLLFSRVEPLGVAWLRIASAAIVFAVWRQPSRYYFSLEPADRRTVVALGVVLAAMNSL